MILIEGNWDFAGTDKTYPGWKDEAGNIYISRETAERLMREDREELDNAVEREDSLHVTMEHLDEMSPGWTIIRIPTTDWTAVRWLGARQGLAQILADALRDFCDREGLEELSADELLQDPGLDAFQRSWLVAFVRAWDAGIESAKSCDSGVWT